MLLQTFKSLKRKHSEIEIEVPPPAKMDIVVEEAPAVAAKPKPELPIEDYRHAKRPKRMMLSIAHTATAMAVGAVATWSALAFS
jgi:hypothetical protein